jgi:hypothetical protein
MKKTKYEVYGTFDDLIKLYRRALKKGYSYGEMEPLTKDDPNISIQTEPTYLRYRRVSRYGFIEPLRKVINVSKANNNRKYFPKVLCYRNYASKSINSPGFELYKLILVREYE